VCTLDGGTGTVALQHLTRRPPGQPHEVAFLAPVSEPSVSEAVTELVRVKLGNASGTTPTAQHLGDTASRQFLAAVTEPEIFEPCERVKLACLFVVT
jgi:hypothetical protein